MPDFKFKITAIGLLNAVGAVVIIYLIVILGQTIKRNYDLNRQIDAVKAQTNLAQDQQAELNYNIQYYKTDSFQEREARAKLGLQLPDENVVILPTPTATPTPAPTDDKTAKPRSNVQQWLDFLAGRG